jgi:hypothetical protein
MLALWFRFSVVTTTPYGFHLHTPHLTHAQARDCPFCRELRQVLVHRITRLQLRMWAVGPGVWSLGRLVEVATGQSSNH